MDKKNKNPNVPNLRFNGYTENWQKYRTIELGQMQRGKSKHRPRDDEKLYGGAYPFIQTGDIKKANLYIKEYERTYSNYGLSQSKLWSKGTLCITIAANIAETAILGLNACFPDSVIGWISNEKITNNIFIKYYFDFYKTQLKRLSVGGAQENLNLDKLENVYFHIPTLPEQNDITNLLTKIDELIETQIKIIDSYFSLSKAISNTLIGQSKGNTRLRECLNCYSSNTMESVIKQEDLGDYPVYGANGIIKKINNYEIEYPSIAIVKDGSGVGKMFKLSGKYSILSTLNYLTSKPGYDIDYIYYALKQKSLKKYVVGSGIPHIYFKDYEQEKIYIPQNELQQQNITSVLQSIDEEIGNEIKQLKNYELLKKYLLKNMFV